MLLARGPSSGWKRGSEACRGHRFLPGTRLHFGTGRVVCHRLLYFIGPSVWWEPRQVPGGGVGAGDNSGCPIKVMTPWEQDSFPFPGPAAPPASPEHLLWMPLHHAGLPGLPGSFSVNSRGLTVP